MSDPTSSLPSRSTPLTAGEVASLFVVNTLVLDPDAATRDWLVEVAANRGHQVSVAASFEEAIRLLGRSNYDCFIFKLRQAWEASLDQLLRHALRATAQGATPYVLAVVLDDPPEAPALWLNRGVDDCLSGSSKEQSLQLRLAVAEKAMAQRRALARAQHQSVGTNKNFENIFRYAPEAVLIASARDGLIYEASEGATTLLGVATSDIRGRYLSLIVPGLLGREELQGGWTDSTAPVRLTEMPHQRSDGSLLTLEVLLGRCLWSDRPALWVRLVDVSFDRAAQIAREREARFDAVRSLAAGASQTLNDALTSVRGNIDLLTKENLSRPEARELIDSAQMACEHAGDTIKVLGSLSRLAMTPARRRSLDLKTFLPKVLSWAAMRSRVVPGFFFDPNLPPIEADETSLKEAILAIADNADQAMANGGPLQVTARPSDRPGAKGPWVVVEFKDAGEGILPQHLPRLFDPYFTTRHGRAGLGLARALAIVYGLGGTIEAESRPGQGALFRIWLPAAQAIAPLTPAPRNDDADLRLSVATAANRGRILVMDDDLGIRLIVEKMLTLHGFDAYCVSDGGAAIDAYRRAILMNQPFDVVLLDLDVRGGMGGRECIARLRGEFPSVKALLATGYVDDALLDNHREHGFSGVLTKPFHLERLISAVTKLAGV